MLRANAVQKITSSSETPFRVSISWARGVQILSRPCLICLEATPKDLHIIVCTPKITVHPYAFLAVRYALTLPGHTIFVNTTTPPGPRKRWFPSSIGDPALFHGIMHISAAHLAASQRSRPSSAYFQHRGEIIRLVNKRITYDQDATSDGTIGAIACLLISDVCLFFARTC